MMAVLLDMPLGILLPAETQQRLRTQFVHSPQHARCPDDARAVREPLHPDPRGAERRPDGHGPMVRQQPCLVPRQVRLEPVPQLRRPWRPIGDQGYIPALNDKLRQDQYMQVLPRDRQTGRHGGVGVHDGADVGPAVQDSEVQVQFTRRVAAPPPLAAAQIDFHHVRRPHQRLDHTGRGHEHPIRPQADRQVAVLSGDEPPLRELPAALRHAAGHRTCRHEPAGASAWWATLPSTIVSAARPMSARPAKGVLRLFEKNAAGSTVQRAVTSSTTTSAAAPGFNVPPGSRNAAAGAVLIRWTSAGSARIPPATSSVYATAKAVSSPTIPKGASSNAASLAS